MKTAKKKQPVDRKTGLRANHSPSRLQRKLPFEKPAAKNGKAGKEKLAAIIGKATPKIVPLSQVHPSPTNPRKDFTSPKAKEGLDSLADTIRKVGFRGRILVRPQPKGKEYEIIYGERRSRAAKLAGLKEIPVDIATDLTDEQVKAIQLVENDARSDLLMSERVEAYGQYVDEGKTADDIHELTGRPVAEVRQIILLRRLPNEVLAAVDAGRLPPFTAELLARIPGDEMRRRVSLHVLAGDNYMRDGQPAPKPKPDDEALSFRSTKELIRRNCQVELKGAPFSRTALDLIGGVPSCDACPKRAGNAALTDPTFKEVRGDTCLDPVCFRAKVDAHNSKTIDTLKKDGQRFLSPKETSKLFPGGYGLTYSAPYVELDSTCFDDSKHRSYRTLLNGCLPKDQVVIAVDSEGKPRELLDKKVAKSLLRQTGKVKTEGRREPSAEEKRRRHEDRVQSEMVISGMEAAAAAAERLLDSPAKLEKAITAMCSPLTREFWSETVNKVLRRRRWVAMTPNGGRQAVGVIAELLACQLLTRQFDGSQKLERKLFFESLGLDLEDLEAEAREIASGKKKRVLVPTCQVCQCTQADCSRCIARTGKPCTWATAKQDLCSACFPLVQTPIATLVKKAFRDDVDALLESLEAVGVRTIEHALVLDPHKPPKGLEWIDELQEAAHEWLAEELNRAPAKPAGGADVRTSDTPISLVLTDTTAAKALAKLERFPKHVADALAANGVTTLGHLLGKIVWKGSTPAFVAQEHLLKSLDKTIAAHAGDSVPAEVTVATEAVLPHLRNSPYEACGIMAKLFVAAVTPLTKIPDASSNDAPKIKHVVINDRPHLVVSESLSGGRVLYRTRPLWTEDEARHHAIAPLAPGDRLEGIHVRVRVSLLGAVDWYTRVIGTKTQERVFVHAPRVKKEASRA